MSQAGSQKRLRVLIAGGGIAAMETALALADLAGELTSVSVLAPNSELVNRPMTVREPFAYPQARRYPLAEIVSEAGAELLTDTLAWVDPVKRVAHTDSGAEIEYDALVLALGARASVRYKHALTIDDRRLDETLHGLIQDLEGGYISTLAFVAPGRMAWPLPLYEIAMMTAGRAWDMGIDVTTTLITPEDRPLGIFGTAASEAVAGCLKRARIQAVTSSYAEVPHTGEVVINPGDHHLRHRSPHMDRRAPGALRPVPARHPAQRTRLHPRGPARGGARCRARLRRRRCHRVPHQARRSGLPAG